MLSKIVGERNKVYSQMVDFSVTYNKSTSLVMKALKEAYLCFFGAKSSKRVGKNSIGSTGHLEVK